MHPVCDRTQIRFTRIRVTGSRFCRVSRKVREASLKGGTGSDEKAQQGGTGLPDEEGGEPC